MSLQEKAQHHISQLDKQVRNENSLVAFPGCTISTACAYIGGYELRLESIYTDLGIPNRDAAFSGFC
jgi:hypothetical protein